jgi:hypothetical protein
MMLFAGLVTLSISVTTLAVPSIHVFVLVQLVRVGPTLRSLSAGLPLIVTTAALVLAASLTVLASLAVLTSLAVSALPTLSSGLLIQAVLSRPLALASLA